MSLTDQIPKSFSDRFAAWLRIEPRCRSDNFASGLQVRTADPLWMLGRQWQIGEFLGEDAGSPIGIDVDYETESANQVDLNQSITGNEIHPLQDEQPQNLPLEVRVEREGFDRESWRTRVQIGQKFELLLWNCLVSGSLVGEADWLMEACRKPYLIRIPTEKDLVQIDRKTQRFIRLMAGRVIDGYALLKAIESKEFPGVLVALTSATQVAVEEAIARLQTWYTEIYNEPGPEDQHPWKSEKLHYSFSVVPENDLPLNASEYARGALDWSDFSIPTPLTWQGKKEDQRHFEAKRVSFPGMPNPRWWAFEDNRTDFGALDVAKPDIAKLMLMELALIYGNDWFVLPLELDLGSVTRIKEVTVTDVFGERISINPGRNLEEDPLRQFVLFEPSPSSPDGNLLFLPPVLGFREESPPMEEVRFFRDEMANMVWGVEHTVTNGLGEPVDGFDARREQISREEEYQSGLTKKVRLALSKVVNSRTAQDIVTSQMVRNISVSLQGEVCIQLALTSDDPRELLAETKQTAEAVEGVSSASVEEVEPQVQQSPTSTPPLYKLSTTVPDNWIPFLPADVTERDSQGRRTIQLVRASMVQNESRVAIPPVTRIATESLRLNEEAVSRSGLAVILTKQRTRWINGKTIVWLGRKVQLGKGEGSSGLRFDLFE